MSLAAIAIEKKVVTYFATFLIIVGGIAAFFSLGQLEDPEFSIKTAVVTTAYPGASPEEVELEVTDRIELALQELPELDYLESYSRAGFSLIKVNIKSEYWSDQLPQIWDTVRRKVRDVEETLPPGAGRPDVGDDFGDVFGFQLAITGDGFSYSELERYAKDLKKDLSLVDGVARVDLWGVQQKVIYLDVSQTQLTQLGFSDTSLEQTLQQQNVVVDAGNVNVQDQRLRIAPTGQFQSPQDIGQLTLRPSLLDSLQNPSAEGGLNRATELIRIRDIGTVRPGYLDPPFTLMRFNGLPALGISITNASGVNIVDVGRRIDARLVDLVQLLPIGIEVQRVHWQSDIVDEAVNNFLLSFAEAVGIVLVVLAIFMGWRLGLIIGTALVVTILGSFMLMAAFGIDLQRMSLGALVIALGMMVDNAIVVADGFVVRVQRGMNRVKAAIEAASQPSWPLLGATVVAVMAFYPIFASTEDAGEYCRTLFTVVAISLLVSWIVSVTVTPLQCLDMLPPPKEGEGDADPYGGRFYTVFRGVLGTAIRRRWFTMGGMVVLLGASIVGFGGVKQLFFPDSSMTKFMVDYWAPEGTRIEQVQADLEALERKLLDDERVESVAAFIGAGPPRFYLPVEPENPYQSYAQLVVNMHELDDIEPLVEELDPWLTENQPQALIPIRLFGVGPADTFKLETRISGPAVADPDVLRGVADDVIAVLEESRYTAYTRTDWRQRVQKVVPVYNQERARWASVTRDDIAKTTKRAFDGRTIGLYREADDLIPIVLRQVEQERQNVGGLDVLQIQPAQATRAVPMSQVTDSVATAWEDPLIWRRDRRRTITVQANPIVGVTFPTLRADVVERIDRIDLPPGYTLEWGGEYEGSRDAQQSLIPGIIPAAVLMALIIVGLFNAFRPPIIIFLTIPFAIIGITAGLLFTGTPFGFVALLGGMSLAGMMIKNAIVLLDQVNLELAEGKSRYDAVVEAAVSRLRPVALAAATTVLGVIPLLQDVFWIGLAVTIMAGLSFGTLLTMIVVPVLYTILFRVPSPEKAAAPRAAEVAASP